jgi:hypothetical protein
MRLGEWKFCVSALIADLVFPRRVTKSPESSKDKKVDMEAQEDINEDDEDADQEGDDIKPQNNVESLTGNMGGGGATKRKKKMIRGKGAKSKLGPSQPGTDVPTP